MAFSNISTATTSNGLNSSNSQYRDIHKTVILPQYFADVKVENLTCSTEMYNVTAQSCESSRYHRASLAIKISLIISHLYSSYPGFGERARKETHSSQAFYISSIIYIPSRFLTHKPEPEG